MVYIEDNGFKRYYKNNLLHREDGPALEYANRDKFWYLNGKSHRLDGPAVIAITTNNKEYYEWWIDGKEIHCKSNEEFLKLVKYKWFI
jgi:hypothetical protein